jgi:hypothetical protein
VTDRVGPYALQERLAASEGREVWRARHLASGLEAALKVMDPGLGADILPDELRLAFSLDHPCIVRVHDHGEVGGPHPRRIWLAMALARGGSLAAFAGRIPWRALAHILIQMCDALAHAHARGVIHRDVKPSNLLLARASAPRSAPTVWLADFGVALGASTGAGAHPRRAGTPAYAAPEQLDGRVHEQGPWTDLYGLACTIWALATGVPPHGPLPDFERARVARATWPVPPLRSRRRIPEGVEEWLRRLLMADPADRPQSVAEATALFARLTGRTWPGRSRPATPSRAGPASPMDGALAVALRPPRFVGRAPLLAQLEGHLDDVSRTGAVEVVLVEGAPGVGTSRLLAEFAHRVHETGAAEVITDGEAGVHGVFDALARRLRLERVAGGLRGTTLERLPAWAAALVHATAAEPSPDGAPSARLGGLAALLSLLAGDRPLLVGLEAGADPEAWGLAWELAGRRAPILLVLVRRPGQVSPLADVLRRRAPTHTLVVPPLDLAATARLVPWARASAEVRRWAARSSQGVPLLALLLAQGGDVHTRGAARLADTWRDRLRRLVDDAPWAWALLELAALFDGDVVPGRWSRAAIAYGLTDVAHKTTDLTRRLLDAGFARAGDAGSWRFVHGSLCEAVVGQMADRRAAGHAAVAWALELEARDGPSSVGLAYARHVAASGDAPRSLAFYAELLERAVYSGEQVVAEAALEEADALLSSGPVDASSPQLRRRLEWRRATLANTRAQCEEARAVAESLLGGSYGPLVPEERAGVQLELARAMRTRGTGVEARAATAAAVEAARSAGAARMLPWACLLHASASDELDPMPYLEAQRAFEALGSRYGAATVDTFLVSLRMLRGEVDEAALLARRNRAAMLEFGTILGLRSAHLWEGDIHALRGDWHRARRFYDDARAIAQAHGGPGVDVTPLVRAALLALQGGGNVEAALTAARASADRAGWTAADCSFALMDGIRAARSGRPAEEVARAVCTAGALLERQGAHEVGPWLLLDLLEPDLAPEHPAAPHVSRIRALYPGLLEWRTQTRAAPPEPR